MSDPAAHHQDGRHPPDSFASRFETISGLSQWVIWLVGLLAVSLVVLIAYWLEMAFGWKLVNKSLYTVLFGLSIATTLMSYRDARFLNRETKLASRQVELLVKLNDISAFLKQAENSIFRSHIEALYNIFLAHSQIQQDNLIEVLHSRLMARNRVAELFASILITLGLIGTIVGLVFMTNALQAKVADPTLDPAQIVPTLLGAGGPMEGLGTAFYTTLIGAVFGGVVLRILTSVVDANIMRYTAHLAELTEVNVLPFMRRMASRLEQAGYYRRLDDEGMGAS